MIKNKLKEKELEISIQSSVSLEDLARAGKSPSIIEINGDEFRLIVSDRATVGMYYINRSGDVYSVASGKFLTPLKDNSKRYHHYKMGGIERTPSGGRKSLVEHHLVAQAFIGERPFIKHEDGRVEYLVIHHKDGNILNNHVDNLEYITNAENLRSDRVRTINGRIALEIYKEYKKGIEDYIIAEKFGVGVRTVSRLIGKETWAGITDEYDLEMEQGGKMEEVS